MVLKTTWITPRAVEYSAVELSAPFPPLTNYWGLNSICSAHWLKLGLGELKINKQSTPNSCWLKFWTRPVCKVWGIFIVLPEVAVASQKLLVKSPGTTCNNSSQTQSPGLVWYLFNVLFISQIKMRWKDISSRPIQTFKRGSWSVPAHGAVQRTAHCSLGTL